MNSEEGIEFLKWASNFPLRLFGGKFEEEYIREEIDSFLKPQLEMIKDSNSVRSLKNGSFGLYELLFGDLDRDVAFKPKDYSPLIRVCSWNLNREYRKVHDQICDYLYT